MNKIYEPELGQAVFGNPSGEYKCPEFVDALLNYLCQEISRVYWNVNQKEWDEYENPRIPNIEYRPYYWGDCTCGWEDKEFTEEHRPDCYQKDPDLAYIRRVEFKIEPSKVPEKYKALCEKYGIPWNDGLGCAVHCTCDYGQRKSAGINIEGVDNQ